jgi:hypothetical protein
MLRFGVVRPPNKEVGSQLGRPVCAGPFHSSHEGPDAGKFSSNGRAVLRGLWPRFSSGVSSKPYRPQRMVCVDAPGAFHGPDRRSDGRTHPAPDGTTLSQPDPGPLHSALRKAHAAA